MEATTKLLIAGVAVIGAYFGYKHFAKPAAAAPKAGGKWLNEVTYVDKKGRQWMLNPSPSAPDSVEFDTIDKLHVMAGSKASFDKDRDSWAVDMDGVE